MKEDEIIVHNTSMRYRKRRLIHTNIYNEVNWFPIMTTQNNLVSGRRMTLVCFYKINIWDENIKLQSFTSRCKSE